MFLLEYLIQELQKMELASNCRLDKEMKSYPDLIRFCAIGEPMIPRPRKPTRAGNSSGANSKYNWIESNKLQATSN